MSMDSIDDLESAEDLIGTLVRSLREVLNAAPDWIEPRPGAARTLQEALLYCRPTCESAPHPIDADLCACPCHERTP